MAMLSLKISVVGNNVVKTMQFDPAMQVYDACKVIRDRIIETNPGNRKYPSNILKGVNPGNRKYHICRGGGGVGC